MLDDILREIVVIIVGKGAEDIADLLNSRKYANEFNIAKKLGITINQTRNILYKISDFGLVSSERQKDKKKGWYTYYWRFEILKCLEFMKNRLLESREKFNNQIIRREEKNYYVCEDCNIECSEDEALLQEFTCDECGELFVQKDNTQLLRGLKRNLERIDEKLEIIDLEIGKERAKIEKQKASKLRKEEKLAETKKEEARIKRAVKKAERDALKAKESPAKKKVVKKKAVAKKVAIKKVVKKKVVAKKSVKKVVKKKVSDKKKVSSKEKVKKKVATKRKVSVESVVKRLVGKKRLVKKKV
jgi:transcription initiation factor TFIIE subunit alpha